MLGLTCGLSAEIDAGHAGELLRHRAFAVAPQFHGHALVDEPALLHHVSDDAVGDAGLELTDVVFVGGGFHSFLLLVVVAWVCWRCERRTWLLFARPPMPAVRSLPACVRPDFM